MHSKKIMKIPVALTLIKNPMPISYVVLGLVSSLEDIGKIVVKTNPNGTPVLIRDVAAVQFGSAIRYGAMTRNGEGEVVGGVVMMLKGSNSADVVKAVKEKLPDIQKSLPGGVSVEPYLDRTVLVNRSIETVEHNLLEGALIVIFVLVLFLGNFRAGLIGCLCYSACNVVCRDNDEFVWRFRKPHDSGCFGFWINRRWGSNYC